MPRHMPMSDWTKARLLFFFIIHQDRGISHTLGTTRLRCVQCQTLISMASSADLSRRPQVSNGVFLMISFVLCMLLREYNTWTGFLVTRVFEWRLPKHSVYLISLMTNTAGTRYSVNGIYLAWRFYFGFPEGLFCIHWCAQQTKCCVINRLVTQ